jgi:type IV pilus assembly protein PilV
MLTKVLHNSRRMAPLAAQEKMRGGSLIEVLVALLLVAFGFLGIGALFNFSIAANKSASSRLVATMLAQDYADIVRANLTGFTSLAYNNAILSFDPSAKAAVTVANTSRCTYPNCTAATAAVQDLALFRQRVRALLPAGDFVATRSTTGNTNAMDIWILWVEGKNTSDPNVRNDVCPPVVVNQTPAPDPYPRCFYSRISVGAQI